MLGIPWTQSMPLCAVNAATRLAEASWKRDKDGYGAPAGSFWNNPNINLEILYKQFEICFKMRFFML